MTELRELHLYGNPDVVDLAPLGKLTKLEVVYLGGTRVKDVSPLRASAAQLRTIDVPKTVSAASLAALKQAAPGLEATVEE